MSGIRKRSLPILIFLAAGFSLHGNPFLGASDGPSPVRQTSRSVPARLIEAQLAFRENISELFSRLTEEDEGSGKGRVLLPLLGFGFLYGLLHALGPGHRKTVVFSLFLARKTAPLEPLLAGFLSSLLHGMSAVGLILAYRTITARLFLQRVDRTSIYLEGITYLLLALMALILLILELTRRSGPSDREGGELGLYGTVAAASLFPCPVALMILTFSLTIGQLPLGILTVVFLSLGMGVVISVAGFLARMGREALYHRLKEQEGKLQVLGKILELGSYAFLILFSLWMALPFLGNFL